MGFLSYSSETGTNIIPQENFEELVHEVFDVIATNISKSLGPLGSSATILNGSQTEATKDGYSILTKYYFNNRYKRMIYKLILAPCTRLNNTVGDGTTTAIVLTNELFSQYAKHKNALEHLYRLPREFIQRWDDIVQDLVRDVKERATPLNAEDWNAIYNLAYVTSNGNSNISKAIADAYRETLTPNIKQKDSPTNESYLVPIEGFDFPTQLISDVYIKNDDMSVEEKDVAVMIFDHKIDTDIFNDIIMPIDKVYRAKGKKLLIIATAYDNVMCDTYVNQYIRTCLNQYGDINLILTQYNFSKLRDHELNDLAVILRTKSITQSIESVIQSELEKKSVDEFILDVETPETDVYRFIGEATKVSLSCNVNAIFKVDGIQEEDEYIETLRRARNDLTEIKNSTSAEKQSFASKVYDANARVLQLEMRNYIYYVGADSQLQKQITWDAIEDVIKCIRSATKYGIVPGCQISIAQACIYEIMKIAKANNINVTELNSKTSTEIYNGVSDNYKLDVMILFMIYQSVVNVYLKVLSGPKNDGFLKMIPNWQVYLKSSTETDEKKKADEEEFNKKQLDLLVENKTEEVIGGSIDNNQVFDLETLEYSPKIITSAETDEMVLRAASELIKILISGNQCIFLDSDLQDDKYETTNL